LTSLGPRKLLMTVDAVGGVWRYAMDLARGLQESGVSIVIACLGPQPTPPQRVEAEKIGELVLLNAPLDWMVTDADDLVDVPYQIGEVATRTAADLLHLNVPSQAAGLDIGRPLLVVSHSCVVTWFRTVRGSLPPEWHWQRRLNQKGFDNADAVVAPSASHAAMLAACYSGLDDVEVVHNAVRPISAGVKRRLFGLAAGRWWDDGKNGRVLDRAAAMSHIPIQMVGSLRGPNGQYLCIENAHALGEVDAENVRELMARASVFVSPSVYEPFGLAPLEAASSGLPLVLSDIPTYRELWDGAALFAPPDDAEGFARLINQLADSAVERRRHGRLAEERAAKFTLQRQVADMQSIYAEALQVHVPAEGRVVA
jgi:glycosyltransferase involved in cell wall biosynthesis